MEINEEIVKEYFTKVKKCFILENVIYKLQTQREGKKKGGGWSDIDLLVYDPFKNRIIDVEVKYRHNAQFHTGKDKTSNINNVIHDFLRSERQQCISIYNPNNLEILKIFVTNRKAFSERKRTEYEKILRDNNIELLYFEKIVERLKKYYQENSNKMTSVIGQMIRIFLPT